MLVVVNARTDPEATLSGWARYNSNLIAVTLLWMATLLVVAGSCSRSDRWSKVYAADGTVVYLTYATEEECNAGALSDYEDCVPPRSRSRGPRNVE